MIETTCPGCHKKIPIGSAAFCPYCGAKLEAANTASKPEKVPIPEEITRGLKEIDKVQDIKKKNKLVDELLAKYPDSLELNTAKLFMTRLADPKSRTLDFSVIKCHLLHFYLTPKDFTNDQKVSMRSDIFHHPQLEKCLSLAENPDAYMEDYLHRLCYEFVNIFLHSSTQYNRSILGFKLERRMDRYLAVPVLDMMRAIYTDGGLTVEQRDQLYQAMYSGFRSDVGSAAYLDELLAENGLPSPQP